VKLCVVYVFLFVCGHCVCIRVCVYSCVCVVCDMGCVYALQCMRSYAIALARFQLQN